ncbi:hypothetical protein K432DRAFT_440993 [Lepidopterella palustris CBS 459.81]|uniref:Amino acid permease/ SLC12A domain-containing protein n=1 Tax=Lepidopterella palustris CBS 459.81 TaxID=1314670 RepID=A0A8E2EG72_9PEZI|nr:hypothetical protein K432DRAFT_440993 [Lepidopterella palustris CBS 459.81]
MAISPPRALFELAQDGQAPANFKRTTKNTVPLPAVMFASLILRLGYINVSQSVSAGFGMLNLIFVLDLCPGGVHLLVSGAEGARLCTGYVTVSRAAAADIVRTLMMFFF